MRRIGAPFQLVKLVLEAIACTNLFLMMVLAFVDVVGRYVFNAPVHGAYEITQIMMGILTFAALPLVTVRQEHISVSLIDGILSSRARWIQQIIVLLAAGSTFAFLAWVIGGLAVQTHRYGDVTMQAHIPLAPFRYFMCAMAAGSLVAVLGLLYSHVVRNDKA